MLLLQEPPLAWLLAGISVQELQERAPALAFLPAQPACMALRHCFLRSSGCITISSSLCGSGPTGIAGAMPEVLSHFLSKLLDNIKSWCHLINEMLSDRMAKILHANVELAS